MLLIYSICMNKQVMLQHFEPGFVLMDILYYKKMITNVCLEIYFYINILFIMTIGELHLILLIIISYYYEYEKIKY